MLTVVFLMRCAPMRAVGIRPGYSGSVFRASPQQLLPRRQLMVPTSYSTAAAHCYAGSRPEASFCAFGRHEPWRFLAMISLGGAFICTADRSKSPICELKYHRPAWCEPQSSILNVENRKAADPEAFRNQPSETSVDSEGPFRIDFDGATATLLQLKDKTVVEFLSTSSVALALRFILTFSYALVTIFDYKFNFPSVEPAETVEGPQKRKLTKTGTEKWGGSALTRRGPLSQGSSPDSTVRTTGGANIERSITETSTATATTLAPTEQSCSSTPGVSDNICGSADLGVAQILEMPGSFQPPVHADVELLNQRRRVHERAAKRLLFVCSTLGGIYVKLGQYISTLNHVLPPEFTTTMAVLTDAAPSRPWREVRQCFEEDFADLAPSPALADNTRVSKSMLGEAVSRLKAALVPQKQLSGALDAVFSYVDPEPIASASIAQVHRAVLRENSEEVALKLQYPNLARQTRADLQTLKRLAKLILRLFPDWELSWLFPEFEQSISEELDFRQEGFNAMRMADLLASTPEIYVPKVYWPYTSRRCLTMEFIRGFKVTDSSALEKHGFNPARIASIICTQFAKMVHVYGFVHVDPHPGNILLRPIPMRDENLPQLVLLDHGMYRRLNPEIRVAYCLLWKALMTQDRELNAEACRRLGVEDSFLDLLCLILTYRPLGSQHMLTSGGRLDPKSQALLRERFKKIQVSQLSRFLAELPRDLLWVLRATNIIRSLNLQLRGSTADRLATNGRFAYEGLELDRHEESSVAVVQEAEQSILRSWWSHGNGDLVRRQAAAEQLGPLALARLTDACDLPASHSTDESNERSLPPPVGPHFQASSSEDDDNTAVARNVPNWSSLAGAATLNLPLAFEMFLAATARQNEPSNSSINLMASAYHRLAHLWHRVISCLEARLLYVRFWIVHSVVHLLYGQRVEEAVTARLDGPS